MYSIGSRGSICKELDMGYLNTDMFHEIVQYTAVLHSQHVVIFDGASLEILFHKFWSKYSSCSSGSICNQLDMEYCYIAEFVMFLHDISFQNAEGIFIFGGEGSRSSITWEWLPSGTNQWQNGNTIIPGYGLREDCAVNIDDTNILLIGGGKTNKRVLKFNTNTKEFTNLGDVLNEGRYGHACQVFKNKIIISGGYRPGKYLDSTEIINLNDLTTAYTAGSLVQAREFHGLAVVHVDNKPTFLAFGGYAYNKFFDSIEMWNPTTETWSMTSMKMSEPKAGFGFLSLPTRLLCP